MFYFQVHKGRILMEKGYYYEGFHQSEVFVIKKDLSFIKPYEIQYESHFFPLGCSKFVN